VLLTITATCEPATDLGYLLHKHPDRLQTFAVATGQAHVFYPEATAERCTAALLLEVDPIALVKSSKSSKSSNSSKGSKGDAELAQYVNDRPYAASSMLAVALKDVFRSALAGRCDARPDLAEQPMPLEIRVPALRCRGGAELARRVFGPLGWTVEASAQRLDPPEWGDSAYLDVTLRGQVVLSEALNHLYVLLPVLDDAKHYWVSTDEVDKLIRAGGSWLAAHPERALITRRYLAHQKALVEVAEERDTREFPRSRECLPDDGRHNAIGETLASPLALLRRAAVLGVLREHPITSVGDFGCGDGALTRDLLREPAFVRIVATDVSARMLGLAAKRLNAERLPEGRLTLLQSSLTYRDDRLAGLDAAVLMEVIEHVDASRLQAVERSVFGFASPRLVVITTPNAEYNALYATLKPEHMRHPDHRFEWTRAEFAEWTARVAAGFGYRAEIRPVGDIDAKRGSPTQLAVFTREAA
jgi:3' terminal RNA ribose 2'-O-methyltransferase Hen1